MTTNHPATDLPTIGGDNWMIQAAAEAAPPLSADTVDRLRLVLAPSRTAVTGPDRNRQKRAA